MKISKLCDNIDGIKLINTNGDKEIFNLTIDNKTADEDSVFFALKGEKTNGETFAVDVLKRGGVVLSENADFAHNLLISGGGNMIYAKDARKAMSQISANFKGNPQSKLKIIVVVGTNGKTSTACILRDILEYSGKRTGIIGTLETRFEDKIYQTGMTTPDPTPLFEILADMQVRGCSYVVMEGSAHAIYYKKMQNIQAEVAIFTNLTQDHLDFFKNMQAYKDTKKSYFKSEFVKTAVVNSDDPTGREIIKEAKIPILSYGIENISDVFSIPMCEVSKFTTKITGEENQTKSGKFIVNYLDEICEMQSNLKGKFNSYNLLSAITTARYLGVDFQTIKGAVAKIQNIKGRYQQIENPLGINIVVDYAHTPDGLENILSEMRKIHDKSGEGKLIALFGCGGNRDKTKRAIMGEIAEKYADQIIITSDNPRFENPKTIAKEIASGIKDKSKLQIIINRETAISTAIATANKGDSIAILGKGHEEYIEENGETCFFSDEQTVRKYI